MMKTLEALDAVRDEILARMGGDWVGDLVIQPGLGLYCVIAVSASAVEDAKLENVNHAAVRIEVEEGTKTDAPKDIINSSPPIWPSGASAIGALAALDTALKIMPDREYHETGEISVRLRNERYEVTFPFDLEPGARGSDFSFRLILDPKTGDMIQGVMPN